MDPKQQESTIEIVCDDADGATSDDASAKDESLDHPCPVEVSLFEVPLFENDEQPQSSSARSKASGAPLIRADGFELQPWKRRQFIKSGSAKKAFEKSDLPDDARYYAGFWRRFAAQLIDWIIVSLIGAVIVLVVTCMAPLLSHSSQYSLQTVVLGTLLGLIYYALTTSIPVLSSLTPAILFHGRFDNGPLVLVVLSYLSVILGPFLVDTIYRAGMESSPAQATLGKMLLRIRVVDIYGERITFLHALFRHISKGVSSIILMIGFIMAATGKHKEALHDRLAKTLVINTNTAPNTVAPAAPTTEPVKDSDNI